MSFSEGATMKYMIQAVVKSGRIVQRFPYGEDNEEHCIHGIKLRWGCDDCDEATGSGKDEEGEA